MTERIYVVSEMDESGNTVGEDLVRAGNQAQAVRHVAADRFIANVATQDDLVRLLAAGKSVSKASEG